MPISGDVDTTYPNKLKAIGIELLESFKGAKVHHKMKCLHCQHEWTATPIAKLQISFKKYGVNGCPACEIKRRNELKLTIRETNIKKLQDRGLKILSDWDGTTGKGRNSTPIAVTVQNTNCGHTFTSSSKNLLNRGIDCTICGIEKRTSTINNWSYANSEEWKKTADIWEKYRAKVRSLTRKTYKKHKAIINPNNLPTGRAGVVGAHHLDHIVPIRYCFENFIPPEICAHQDNLQMLHWNDNVGSRNKLKNYVPTIFEQYIKNIT